MRKRTNAQRLTLQPTKSAPNLIALNNTNSNGTVTTTSINNTNNNTGTSTPPTLNRSSQVNQTYNRLPSMNNSPVTSFNSSPVTNSYYYTHTPLPSQHAHLLQTILQQQSTSNSPITNINPSNSNNFDINSTINQLDPEQLHEMLYFPKYKKAKHTCVCQKCRQRITIYFHDDSLKIHCIKVYDPTVYFNQQNSFPNEEEDLINNGTIPTEGISIPNSNNNQNNSVNGGSMIENSNNSSSAVAGMMSSSFSGGIEGHFLGGIGANITGSSSFSASSSSFLSSSGNNGSFMMVNNNNGGISMVEEQQPESIPSPLHNRSPTTTTNPFVNQNSNPIGSKKISNDVSPLLRDTFKGSNSSSANLSNVDKKRFSFNPKKKEAQQIKIQQEKQLKFHQRMLQLQEEQLQLDERLISNELYEYYNEFIKNLYIYLSEVVLIDTPLCTECMESISYQLENIQLKNLLKEEIIYKEYLDKVNNNEEEEFKENEKLLLELEKEELELEKELNELKEMENEILEREIIENENQNEFQQLEYNYWKEYNNFQHELQLFNEERETIQQRIIYISKELEKLNSTNVFNDAFHIWYEGHFGTINNFRLGKLPTQNVEWNEINAAWGQAALLLFSLSKHKHFAFSKYKIIPMGSFSRIETLDNKNSYDLFGGGSIGGLFWQSKFDKAMVAFLHCLKELGTFAEKQDAEFELPYKILDDKVGGKSIKLGNDENWTRACKYVLTDLKYLISFCVSK
ncbi:hypothetical protein ABK040_003408 [Willaertia magna]